MERSVDRHLLLIPGPTPVPERILRAMSRQMVSHRGREFKEVFSRVTEGLRRLIETESFPAVYASSGTGAMEAALANLFSPGDAVLCFVMGAFGKRFADIARARGLAARVVQIPLGKAVEPSEAERIFLSDLNHPEGPARGILLTHNETSTGVTIELEAVSRAAADSGHPGLRVVDAVSSLGALELRMDPWGIDAVVSCSQKALMCPPGLGMLVLSPRAQEACGKVKHPGSYWNYLNYAKRAATGGVPYTPAIPIWFALDESLKMIEEEGLQAVWERHRELGRVARKGIVELGYDLFADPRWASDTVTTFRTKPGIDDKKFRRHLEDEWGLTIAGGQQELEGKIFRIGHMGYTKAGDLEEAFSRLAEAEKTWLG